VFICLLSTTKSTRPQKILSVKKKIKKIRPSRLVDPISQLAASLLAALNKLSTLLYNIYMSRVHVDIAPARSGEELLKAWREFGYEAPGGNEPWAEAIDHPEHDILIARMGAFVAGFVDIKYDGPIRAETEFSEGLEDEFNNSEIPVFYKLEVHPDLRRNKIGTQLVEFGEKLIVDNDLVPNMASLNVVTTNVPAVDFYLSLGYRKFKYKGQEEASINFPVKNDKGEWVKANEKVFLMAKDLSAKD
jgi:ribosomal protein S18 acetylase RimI-like enzyme